MTLVDDSVELIKSSLEVRHRPAIACSFGKDSMVMLWLARQVVPDIPVLYFDAFAHETKHTFAERMIKEWNLNVIRMHPKMRSLNGTPTGIEVVEWYEPSPNRFLYFPIESEPNYIPDAQCNCTLTKIFDIADSDEDSHFDAVLIGHRGDDHDPTFGDVPLKQSVVSYPDFSYIYPLKDWTESDIWKASETYSIPQNERRYNGDMSHNNDYYPLCNKCLTDDAVFTICPQTGLELPVRHLNLTNIPDQWKSVFVNMGTI